MAKPTRATVYLDTPLHRARRLKAAATDRSVSELVNAAVRESLRADAEDLAAYEARAREPSLAFEDVLKDLRRRGKLSRPDQAPAVKRITPRASTPGTPSAARPARAAGSRRP